MSKLQPGTPIFLPRALRNFLAIPQSRTQTGLATSRGTHSSPGTEGPEERQPGRAATDPRLGRTPATDLSQPRATAAHHEREGAGLPPAEPARTRGGRVDDITAGRRGDAVASRRVRGLARSGRAARPRVEEGATRQEVAGWEPLQAAL